MANKTTYELQVKLGAMASPSWQTTIHRAQQGLEGLNTLSNRIMAGIAAGATIAAATTIRALSDAVETYTEFEQEMAVVQSISGATGNEFLAMKEAALEAGRTTIYTATESASALEYMSLAGWDVNKSIKGLNPILELAASTGKDLQVTSDLVTDSMSALGLQVDYLDRYLDKLIESNNDANTSAEQMMESLVRTGGASRVLGASLDDTITAVEVLANNGKKGEEAGTALNAILVRLAGNTQAIKELDRLGVDLWDDNGKFIGLKESLEEIDMALSKLTDEDKTISLKNIAGTRYYSQMAYLLDAVEKTGDGEKSAWESLRGQLENSEGALDDMYAITTDTLLNAQKRLQSAKDDMKIRVVDVFADDSKEMISWLAERLPDATDSIVEFAEAHKGEFADAIEDLGEGIVVFWENGIAAGQWIVKNRSSILGTLTGIAAGITAVKVSMLALKAVQFFSNPINAIVTLAGLAATAMFTLSGAMRDAEREAVSNNLADHFGDIALSMEDIEEAAKHIVNSSNLTGVLNALEEFSELDTYSKSMEEAVNTLDKLNWKVSIGMELTTEDSEEYQRAIDEFVKNANEYALQAQYSVSLNMAVTFDENDLEENNIVNKVNQFYSDKYQELSELGTDLNKALTNAFNDGLLEIDEVNVIADIQAKMAQIEKELAVGDFEAQLSVLEMDYSGGKLDSDSFQKLQEELDLQVEEATNAYREAYVKNYSAITASYQGGYLTDKEYEQAKQKLQETLQSDIADVELRAIQFQINTINGGYSGEIGEYKKAVRDALEEYGGDAYASQWENSPALMWQTVQDAVIDGYSDNTSKKAIEDLLGNMSGSIDGLYKLAENMDSFSPEMQQQIQDAITNIETLRGFTVRRKTGGFTGDMNGLSVDIATELEKYGYSENNGMYAWVDQYYHDLTGHNVITESIKPAIDGMYTYSSEYFKEVFAQGFETEADVKITPVYDFKPAFKYNSIDNLPLYHNAEGGIYNNPILTTFAEKGAEAAIPLDGSERAKNLWTKAGMLLGMFSSGNRDRVALEGIMRSNSGSSSDKAITVSYNPVITIQGNASREDVDRALSISLQELKEMLVEIQREDSRIAFS